ncbi:MAG: YraN family protein [Acidimicrobiales bacterium]|nr:YraN family protein [Acidimicrobiales bacterium]
MADRRRALGASGEEAAARWYVERGYDVLARNWRCRSGEIDLILRRGRTVVISEVKTRSSDAFGAPVEAVGRDKRVRLRHLAARWLEESGVRAGEIRFDVVSVLAGQVEVIEGAF